MKIELSLQRFKFDLGMELFMFLTVIEEILKVSIRHEFIHKEELLAMQAISYELFKVGMNKFFHHFQIQLHSKVIMFHNNVDSMHEKNICNATI